MHVRLLLGLFAAALTPTTAGAANGTLAAEFTRTALVLAPVHLNGRGPYYFLIDTGATTTTLDDSLATQLGIRATGGMEIVTSAGTFRAPLGTLDELSVGSVRRSTLPVIWMPLHELRKDDARIAGILGQDLLGRQTLIIDYTRRRVELAPEECPNGDPSSDLGASHGRPMISAAIYGQGLPRHARLVLDSGANALVLFTRLRSATQMTTVSTHQATISAAVLPRVRVEVGGLRREGPAVLIEPTAPRAEDGLIPTAWFSRVCIDGPRARVTMAAAP